MSRLVEYRHSSPTKDPSRPSAAVARYLTTPCHPRRRRRRLLQQTDQASIIRRVWLLQGRGGQQSVHTRRPRRRRSAAVVISGAGARSPTHPLTSRCALKGASRTLTAVVTPPARTVSPPGQGSILQTHTRGLYTRLVLVVPVRSCTGAATELSHEHRTVHRAQHPPPDDGPWMGSGAHRGSHRT